MKTVNGWDVYMKIKELHNGDGDGHPIHVNDLTEILGIRKELLREYLTALTVLDFIKYTDHAKEAFVFTDSG